jgi:hypothetical protein
MPFRIALFKMALCTMALCRTALFRMATARYDAAVVHGDSSRVWACGLSRVIDA